MATPVEQVVPSRMETPAVVLAAGPPRACGECAYHIPHASTPDGWCACASAALRWRTVTVERAACARFSEWPERGPASDSPEAKRL